MRILMVAPYWDPVTGGGERVLKQSSLALRDRGHHIDILTLNTDANLRAIWKQEESTWKGMHVRRWPAFNLIPPDDIGINGFAMKVLARLFPQQFVVKYFYQPGFQDQTRGYDLIQLHNDIELGFLWLLRNSDTPRVLWCHTLDVTYEYHYKLHRSTRDIFRKSADHFLTGCTSTISSLREMDIPTDRISTVHYGVDEKAFEPDFSLIDKKTILFVGGLQPHKGSHILLQALRHLKTPAHVVLLTISRGNLQYEQDFVDGVEQEKSRGFHTLEHVPNMRDPGRLRRYYQEATVLATPSIESVFELVNLEAMSSGTPVVASRVGGFPDLIVDGVNGFLVPPNDPAALAEQLDEFLTHPDMVRRLGEESRRTILKEFTWTRVGEKLEACYQSLLEKSGQMRA